jgi:hypothetical protein
VGASSSTFFFLDGNVACLGGGDGEAVDASSSPAFTWALSSIFFCSFSDFFGASSISDPERVSEPSSSGGDRLASAVFRLAAAATAPGPDDLALALAFTFGRG